jgi:hypothetical protein
LHLLSFFPLPVKMPRKRLTLEGAQRLLELSSKATQPRLWNGKRKIKSGRILNISHTVLATVQKVDKQAWKQIVSEDVVKFIEDAKLNTGERKQCLQNPNRYLSYPANVPTALRKQVYLYETLYRFLYLSDPLIVLPSTSSSGGRQICRPNTPLSKCLYGSTSST